MIRREKYTIFVMIDGNPSQLPLATMQGYDGNETQLPLLTAQGDDGPGAYGTGFTLTVRPASCDHSGDA